MLYDNICVWYTTHEKQFHSMQAYERFNYGANCVTFVSYKTPIATYDGFKHLLFLHTNPYAYSPTTSRQFNRWLREKFYDGQGIINVVRYIIENHKDDFYIECSYIG